MLLALEIPSVSAKMAAVTRDPLGDPNGLAIWPLWRSKAKHGSFWNPLMLLQTSSSERRAGVALPGGALCVPASTVSI